MSNIDLRKALEDERNRRLASAVPQVNDANQNAGRFGMAERKAREQDDRTREHRAQEFRDWFYRAKGRAASDAEVAEYMGRGEGER